MASATTWRVELGSLTLLDNITSFVMGMSIDQNVDVNVIGRGTCSITLDNSTGAFTPGGGGTYSSTDWFAQGLFVKTVLPGVIDVFNGVITDFQLSDTGKASTVTITAQDALTVAARTVGSQIVSAKPYLTLYRELVDRTGIVFPRFGGTNAEGYVLSEYPLTQPTVGLAAFQYVYPNTYADALQTYLIPSVNDVTWATTIALGSVTTAYINSLGSTTTRSSANRVDVEFVPRASITTSQFPFSDAGFVQAFNNEELITQAQVKGSITGATTQQSIASTNTTYGNRTVQYTSTLHETDAQALATASLLTARYSTSRFQPTQIVVKASQVKQFCNTSAESIWVNLLSIDKGLWQRAKITWKGTNANTQTAYAIIKGRKIDVTPSDTVVTFRLGNWADNHSFILNTDQLDSDRLG